MSSSGRLLLTALVAAAVAGCLPVWRQTGGYSIPVFEPARMPPAATFPGVSLAMPAPLSVTASLFAAGADEAPEEIVEFYIHEEIDEEEHEGEPDAKGERGELKPRSEPRFPGPSIGEPRARRRRPPSGKSTRLGLRYGLFWPGESVYDWPESQCFGLYLRRTPRREHSVGTEFGAGFVKLEAPEGSVFTRMYVLHADLLLGRMGGRGLAAYVVVGGQAIYEEADLYFERDVTAFGGAAEIGLAIGSGSGRWEIRGVYTKIMSPGRNAEDAVTASLGIAF